MIRAVVIDDHPIFREGVIHALRAAGDIDVVASAGSAPEAIRLAAEARPDVMVLDMNLPGIDDGIQVVQELAGRAPAVRILMLTVVADEARVCEAMQKGARGYLPKGVGGLELIHAVRAIQGGEFYMTPQLAGRVAAYLAQGQARQQPAAGPVPALNTREQQVLDCLGQGLSNKEIGQRLILSEKTVKHYVTGLLQKLGARNRVEAALMAPRPGADPAREGMAPGTAARVASPAP